MLSGCTTVEKGALNNIVQDIRTEAIEITEETMTGYLQHIDTKTRVVSLDITNWVNRGKTEANDMMHSKKITYNENTVFQDEYGSVVYTEDLKIGERS